MAHADDPDPSSRQTLSMMWLPHEVTASHLDPACSTFATSILMFPPFEPIRAPAPGEDAPTRSDEPSFGGSRFFNNWHNKCQKSNPRNR